MKLGVFTPVFNHLTFEEMIKSVSDAGLEAVEIGSGGSPGNAHLNLATLLNNPEKRSEYQARLTDKGLSISALSAHHNPISPNKAMAKAGDQLLRDTIKLASLMGVPVVNGFSGVSGGNDTDTAINWPVIPWPFGYEEIYNYQWEHKLIPYWREINQYAGDYGVKIGIEMHGGFLVHTPATMLRLREEAGKNIGCNFDPSHMWWQGVDPVAAIRILDDAIVHFHAKDTMLYQDNINMYGLTDIQPYGNIKTRAWNFRTVGFGHDMKVWADIVSALRMVGYDHVLSIEHEDPLMSVDEGLNYAIKNLNTVIMRDEEVDMWWA